MKYLYALIIITIISVFGVNHLKQDKSPIASIDGEPIEIPITNLGKGDLADIRELGTLRVLVPFNRSDFYLYNGTPTGIQVDVINEYIKYLNQSKDKSDKEITAAFIPTPFDQLIKKLNNGEGDVAAAMMTVTEDRKKKVNFASNIKMAVNEVIVTHKDTPDILNESDLSGKTITVMAGSSYLEHLTKFNQKLARQNIKKIDINVADNHLSSEDILELVNAGIEKITVIDDYKARLWSKNLENLKIHESVPINQNGRIGWAVRKNNPDLLSSIEGFQNTVKKGTLLGNLFFDKYFNNTKRIKNPLISDLSPERKKALELFEKYGKKYNFDPTALAAQAYQESGLNNSAVSDKGAIGIMQLLPSTAKDMGFEDVSSLEDNIHAGVKYLDHLRAHYVNEDSYDTTNFYSFLWASYNAGPNKIKTIKNRALEMGLNDNEWFSNAEYAALDIVGKETVNYVSNIYKYYLIYQGQNILVAQK